MASTNKEWSEKAQIRTDTKKYLKENIGDLLASLAQQDKLPAIVFCWDKYLCEELVAAVVEWLEKEEFRKSSTSVRGSPLPSCATSLNNSNIGDYGRKP